MCALFVVDGTYGANRQATSPSAENARAERKIISATLVEDFGKTKLYRFQKHLSQKEDFGNNNPTKNIYVFVGEDDKIQVLPSYLEEVFLQYATFCANNIKIHMMIHVT